MTISLALAAVLLGVPVAGVQQRPQLTTALTAVRVDDLRSDLFFIASDELAGRDTPSHGLDVARLYIHSRLTRLGFTEGGPQGWDYEYPLEQKMLDAQASRAFMRSEKGKQKLVFGDDYFFRRTYHLTEVDAVGDVVAIGDGKLLSGYDKVELEGHWALVSDRGRGLGRLDERLAEHGAIGILLVPGSKYKKKPYDERYEGITNRFLTGTVRNPATSRTSSKPPILPVVMVGESARDRLFELATREWEGTEPPFGHVLGVEFGEVRQPIEREILVSNVCGFWPGSDPDLSKEVLVVTAHYDHVGVNRGDVYNGADDNGSGTVGLLAVAKALHEYGPMKRSVLLMWLSGEEKGLWGSAAWTKSPWLPEGHKAVVNLNIDMIGRTGDDELYITPSSAHKAHNEISKLASELAPLEGFPELKAQDEYWQRSDHFNFARNLEIPVAFISSGDHPDYHKASDTPDKIRYEKMARVVRLFVRILDGLQGELAPDPGEIGAGAATNRRNAGGLLLEPEDK